MREILFRGKSIYSDGWVEGIAFPHDDKSVTVFYPIYGGFDEIEVIPETIGQYTGLTDKNGKKIFEGDILSAHLDDAFPDEETRGCVCWHDYGWHIKIGAHLETLEQDWVGQFLEVIGNIYDNPELLKGEEK